MTRIVKKELGVTWTYWLCIGAFLFVSAIAFYVAATTTDEKEDKRVLVAAGTVFLTLGFGGLAWPFLRSREAGKLETQFIHAFGMHCDAIFFPASRVKEVIIVAGSFLLFVGTLSLFLFADTVEHRIKGGIAFVALACISILTSLFYFSGRKGVLLTCEGVIWREIMKPPCLIPWDVISKSALFLKELKYVSKPALAFGIDVNDVALVRTANWNRSLIARSKQSDGWHFHFLAETILPPLPSLAAAVQFYLHTPEARGEIGSSASLTRITSMETHWTEN